MSFKFTKKDFKKIAKALDINDPVVEGNHVRYEIENIIGGRKLTIEIYPELQIGSRVGNLITAYTPFGVMQLHFCTNYIASDELGEVILFAENKDKINGFVIGKNAELTCYANVDKDLIAKDPFKLSGEVIGCAMQLSLTEHKLEEIH